MSDKKATAADATNLPGTCRSPGRNGNSNLSDVLSELGGLHSPKLDKSVISAVGGLFPPFVPTSEDVKTRYYVGINIDIGVNFLQVTTHNMDLKDAYVLADDCGYRSRLICIAFMQTHKFL